MFFNTQKYKVMHIGKTNRQFEYSMNGIDVISNTEIERDLGVIVSKVMKVFQHCSSVYGKANKMLGLIKRNIKHKKKDVMLILYKSIVRPHVEYCSSAWNPYYRKDVNLIERIQHRFTRLLPDLRNVPYLDRLKDLGLWSLEERKNRADLIEVFKLLKGFSNVPLAQLFEMDNSSRTKGHAMKIVKQRFVSTMRKHFFSQRVITRWNSLDESAVSSTSINGLKNQLDRLRKQKMRLFMD
jgi:ribonucleases P/MRP protein subunit RPP40